MTYDPRKTVDAPGTSPDHGMNARNYVLIVVASVLALLVLIAIFALRTKASGARDDQRQTPATQPSGPSPQ